MREFKGDMLLPLNGKHESIMIFLPLNTTGEPNTELQFQVRDELPTVHTHYENWCRRVRQNNGDFHAGCVNVHFLPQHGYEMACCCLFNIEPNVDFRLNDIKTCIADITGKYDNQIIRIPWKLGRHDWLMSDVQWDEIMELLRVKFPHVNFEIWRHESHEEPIEIT